MVLQLNVERTATKTSCATSGAPLRAGTGVVRLISTCGGAQWLQPVIRAVGPDAAAAALAAMPGLTDLSGRQQEEVRRTLQAAAVAAAAATAVADGTADSGSPGDTGRVDGAGDDDDDDEDNAVEVAEKVVARRQLPLRGSRTTTVNAADAKPQVRKEVGKAAADDSEVDLDKERAEIMERNRRKLLELQLPGLVSGLAATRGHAGGGARREASQRGVGAKRSRERSQEPQPLRMSLRQRGVAAELAAGIEHERSTGVLLAGGPLAAEAEGNLPFRSGNGDEETDAAFLAVLKERAMTATSSTTAAAAAAGAARRVAAAAAAAGGGAGGGRPPGAVLSGIHLVERDVAKVTKDGVTHLAWLPDSDRLTLAAADKSGKVSLWDVDVEAGGPAEKTAGILMFQPHSEYVSGLRWLGRDAAVGPCRLITTSYDGSVRALDLGGSGMWVELPAPGDPRSREFSALDVSSDGRTAYLGDPQGNLDLVDLRAPPPRRERSSDPAATSVGPLGGLQISQRKINSVHLEPFREILLASTSSDGSICIWDVRKVSHKPLSVLHHARSCHSAYWAHDGSTVLSIPHNNQTGRWITPFRAVWNAACDAVLVGNMSRGVDIFGGLGAVVVGAAAAVKNNVDSSEVEAEADTDGDDVDDPDQKLRGRAKTSKRKAAGKASATAAAVKAGGGGDDPLQVQFLHTLTSEYMTAIPSRLACHPTMPVVVAATCSGRCHVWSARVGSTQHKSVSLVCSRPRLRLPKLYAATLQQLHPGMALQ
ncbi:hypothetical protein VOLCADRAFT_117976 [Volvox carteri f. nagariensis]|uniref:Uncharacterized protein n=1 Tax=Volvox carteri f. nagariensis TaxID=3068 RepID=D8TZK8_VOLCA|nr:uncharacterized protein VOLCADRAFT_117976 [Volvox carteri f. nagariensis]EFJ46944.1 hypothetical protein VOLCADRAFT_117976 [Volvox carteri f. nagariensis]|eukprot:XP_002951839.1 hypothetical protein VOLCADRAFT_117976 [Volvox carteri f. nagariensis]